MTSTRAPVPPVDLKARIAALQQQQANAQAAQANSTSQVLPKANAINGPNALKDRIASFEKQGAVPKPKGRFGFAPPMEKVSAGTKSGELWGNRIPGLSRPHIPVPEATKTEKKQPRSRSASRLELDRYSTLSPPDSPFVTSDNGDSVGDVVSDSELSPDELANLQESQQQSLDALIASTNSESVSEAQEEVDVPEAPSESADVEAVVPAEVPDPDVDQQSASPAIVVSPSEPAGDAPAVVASDPAPAPSPDVTPEPVATEPPEPLPEPPALQPTSDVPDTTHLTAASPTSPVDDADLQMIIEQLDRATRMGAAGSVVVPAVALQTLAEFGGSSEQQQVTVQDMLDQLLLQQDALDVATPIKQRFSLNGSLSQFARNFLAQQVEQAAKEQEAKAAEAAQKETKSSDGAKGVVKSAPTIDTQPSSQFLSPNTPSAYSPESPSTEPLSPASDIYASYLAATPAVPFGRALPAIPEAPDSPAEFKNSRRGTFGNESSSGSTAPSSPPPHTPSDDGNGSVAPADVPVKVTHIVTRANPSPPLSVVIPGTERSRPLQPSKDKVGRASVAVVPDVQRTVAAPAPPNAPVPPASASTSSPSSVYSPTSAYSAEGPSPSGGRMSRKTSTSSRGRHTLSPPPSAPYDEPVLTPLEGPKGFRAVVHEKVVEGKSRPVSVVPYPDLPSPTPMNPGSMGGDLAALLADAAMLEQQLATTRTPQKGLPSRPGAGVRSIATPPPARSIATPPPALGRGTPDRPKPVQDLPESPNDAELYGRPSLDQSILSRTSTSQIEFPRQSVYEHRPLPVRPSIDRESKASRPSIDRIPRPSAERGSSRPSLERVPSRPSFDSRRPSVDSTSSSRPQLQPMFLSADPNAVKVPLPARPKSAMAHASASRSSTSTPPNPPKSPPRTGYLTNLLSRAKSSGNLRPDPRDSVGSSSEDSVMVSTPPTPPYEMTTNETGSVRSSRMFKNSFSRASNFADRLLHRKDGSQQGPDVVIASGDADEDDSQMSGSRTLPRPPRPLPRPPRPLPPGGLPPLPPVPGEQSSNNNLAPAPAPGQPGLQRRGSWKSIASVSTIGISETLTTMYDSFPSVPETVPRPETVSRTSSGVPPNAYTAPRPAPRPPSAPPPSQPLPPPPPNQPLPAPPRTASRGVGLPPNPAYRSKTLPTRPRAPTQGQLRSGMI